MRLHADSPIGACSSVRRFGSIVYAVLGFARLMHITLWRSRGVVPYNTLGDRIYGGASLGMAEA
jgi:hypothetical protein